MAPLKPGTQAPPIPGIEGSGLRLLFFYKVTCPTCQLSAPVAEKVHRRFGDRFAAIGQDPPEKLARFAHHYESSFTSVADQPPYDLSNAYGIRVVPTLFAVEDGVVLDVVESWDRDGWNRIAAKAGELAGVPAEAVSWDGDGLPPFRPG